MTYCTVLHLLQKNLKQKKQYGMELFTQLVKHTTKMDKKIFFGSKRCNCTRRKPLSKFKLI
jgi:hypothetical protein